MAAVVAAQIVTQMSANTTPFIKGMQAASGAVGLLNKSTIRSFNSISNTISTASTVVSRTSKFLKALSRESEASGKSMGGVLAGVAQKDAASFEVIKKSFKEAANITPKVEDHFHKVAAGTEKLTDKLRSGTHEINTFESSGRSLVSTTADMSSSAGGLTGVMHNLERRVMGLGASIKGIGAGLGGTAGEADHLSGSGAELNKMLGHNELTASQLEGALAGVAGGFAGTIPAAAGAAGGAAEAAAALGTMSVASGKVGTTLPAMGKSVIQAGGQVAGLAGSVNNTKRSIEGLEGTAVSSQSSVKTLGDMAAHAAAGVVGMATGSDKAEKAVGSLVNRGTSLSGLFKGVGRTMGDSGGVIKGVTKMLTGFGGTAESAGASTSKFGQVMQGANKATLSGLSGISNTAKGLSEMGGAAGTAGDLLGQAATMATGAVEAFGVLGTAGLALVAIIGVKLAMGAIKMLTGLPAALGRAAQAWSGFTEQASRSIQQFGSAGKAVVKFGAQVGPTLAMSATAALESANQFGALFAQMRLSDKATADLSTSFVRLAADTSSFTNIDASQVLQDIRSGLTGEVEPMRKYGVFLNDTAVAAEAVKMGIARQGEELSDNQKIMARGSMIAQQLGKAQGDLARTSGGLANTQRQAAAWSADLSKNMGRLSGPVVLIATQIKSGLIRMLDLLVRGIATVTETIVGAIMKWTGFGMLLKGLGAILRLFGGSTTDAAATQKALKDALGESSDEIQKNILGTADAAEQIDRYGKVLATGNFALAEQIKIAAAAKDAVTKSAAAEAQAAVVATDALLNNKDAIKGVSDAALAKANSAKTELQAQAESNRANTIAVMLNDDLTGATGDAASAIAEKAGQEAYDATMSKGAAAAADAYAKSQGNVVLSAQQMLESLAQQDAANAAAAASTTDLGGGTDAAAQAYVQEAADAAYAARMNQGVASVAKEVAAQTATTTGSVDNLTAAYDQAIKKIQEKFVEDQRTNEILDEQKKKFDLIQFALQNTKEAQEKYAQAQLHSAEAGRAQVEAEKGVQNALQGTKDALHAVAELQYHRGDGAKRVEAAEHGVATATQAVADAIYAQEQAQKAVDKLAAGPMWWDVTEAVNAHNKAIRDVTRATLAYEQAGRAVTRADLELADAELNVQKATLAVGKAQRDAIRASLAVGDAQRDIVRAGMAAGKAARDEVKANLDLAASHDAVRAAEQHVIDLGDQIKQLRKEQKKVTADLQAALHKTASAAEKNATTLEEALAASSQAFTAFAQGVQSSVKDMTNPMKRFETDSTVAASTIVSNLQRNLADVALWQDNLKKIASRGFAGLSRSLAQLGPDAAMAVADFANGSLDQLASADQAFKDQGKALGTSAIVGLSNAVGDTGISTDYVTGLKDQQKDLGKQISQANTDMAAAKRDVVAANLAVKDSEDAVVEAQLASQAAANAVTLAQLAYQDALDNSTLANWAVDEAVRAQTLSQLSLADAQANVVSAGLSLQDSLEGIDAANKVVIESAMAMNELTAASSIITDEETNAQRTLDASIRGVADAQYNLGAALDGVKDAKHEALQWAYDMDAANRNVTASYDAQFGSMISKANAFADANKADLERNGLLQTQAQRNQALVQSLQDQEAHLAPNSPLRTQLDAYIASLKAVPPSIATTLNLKTTSDIINFLTTDPTIAKMSDREQGQKAFDMLGLAQGGVVTSEIVAKLGERGPEVVAPLSDLAKYMAQYSVSSAGGSAAAASKDMATLAKMRDSMAAQAAMQERAAKSMQLGNASAEMQQAMKAMAMQSREAAEKNAAMADVAGRMANLSTASSAGGSGGGGGDIYWTGNVIVQGSVISERNLIVAVKEGLLKQQRNGGNLGIEGA